MTDDLADWFWQHEHRHVCSNHPGGHLCSRQCVSSALLRSSWLKSYVEAIVAARLAAVEALAAEWEHGDESCEWGCFDEHAHQLRGAVRAAPAEASA